MKGETGTVHLRLGTCVPGCWRQMEGLILWEINTQPRRFGELKRLLPLVSEKMLTQHLRELERDGIFHREMFHEVPPRVEYSVTELGTELIEALSPLRLGREAYDPNTGHP